MQGKLFSQIGLTISLIAGVLISILLVLCRQWIPLAFTTEAEIVEITVGAVPFLAIAFIPSCGMYSMCGTIKGMGLQGIAAKASILVNLVLAIPMSYLMGVRAGWGLPGLFTGIFAAAVILTATFMVITSLKNW